MASPASARSFFTALFRLHSALLPSRIPQSTHRVIPPSIISTSAATFSTSQRMLKKQMPTRPKPPPEEEIEEAYVKGSGPGGQKINKTNSAVQLKHIPTGIVVKCQASRSRSENRNTARKLLAERLDDLNNGEHSRAAIVAAAKRKKQASSAKKRKRKYKKLEYEADADAEELETDIAPAEKQTPEEAPNPAAAHDNDRQTNSTSGRPTSSDLVDGSKT